MFFNPNLFWITVAYTILIVIIYDSTPEWLKPKLTVGTYLGVIINILSGDRMLYTGQMWYYLVYFFHFFSLVLIVVVDEEFYVFTEDTKNSLVHTFVITLIIMFMSFLVSITTQGVVNVPR